jgi:hypothetical protein
MNIQMNELHDIGIRDNIVFFQLSTMVCFSKFFCFLNIDGQCSTNNEPWMCIFNLVFHGNGPIKLIVFDKSFS